MFEFLSAIFAKKTNFNIKALRNLRVLRPLRSVNVIPNMRRLVGTLINSFHELVIVGVFISFLFILFGILGLQLFQGVMYNACRVTDYPLTPNYWEKAPSDFSYRLCSNFSTGGHKCLSNQVCGNPTDADISLREDGVYNNPDIMFGLASFDNFL